MNKMFYHCDMEVKFASRLKEVRLENGMTCKQLADALNVSTRLVHFWESGDRECNFEMLLKLSELLNVSTDYLLGKNSY